MKTLARPRDEAEILHRLKHIRAESVARWGRMSAHQMVCHLTDSLRMAIGERAVSTATPLGLRTLVKWIALYLPLRWPPGIRTRPEIDQEIGGTKPKNFAADVAQLESLLEAVTGRGEGVTWITTHPAFGRMSKAAWLRWAYLHADHHLRQFGA